ncbi:MAG: DNA methylase [Planctomycetota bacterium]|nr:MAG: DNA methylase [Planctomycetota bacterium]
MLSRTVPKPRLQLQTTTLWQYPSGQYGKGGQGDPNYRGATPSYVIWNLLQRYTLEKHLVVDPMAGGGTTLDVARDLNRRALGYDLQPTRRDVFRADARKLPLEDGKADFIFCDPPYGNHLKYSGSPACIGELDAHEPAYFEAMNQVFGEFDRILRPDRYLAVYTGDSWSRKGFVPIGARFMAMLEQQFQPVDHVAVVRGNRDLQKGNYHQAAEQHNFYLRGFHHLLIFYKPEARSRSTPYRSKSSRRRSRQAGTTRAAAPKRKTGR